MTWYAKPSGSYGINSVEGLANIWEMASCFPAATDEAKAAIIGNSVHEGGLNPWRWQYDSASSIDSLGYGLFQFSPGSGYINSGFPTIAPNLSVTSVTQGARADDGQAQCEVLGSDYMHKWVSDCWRSYWSQNGQPKYPDLWAYRQEVLNRWGSGSRITLAQFMQCQDVDAATFIFLACFEGPKVPNYTTRKNTAAQIYKILTGQDPPTPPVPPVPPDPVQPVPIDANLLAILARKKKRKIIRRV